MRSFITQRLLELEAFSEIEMTDPEDLGAVTIAELYDAIADLEDGWLPGSFCPSHETTDG